VASPSRHKQGTQACHPHSVYRRSATDKIMCFCNDSIGFWMDDPLATPLRLATIKLLFMDQWWSNVAGTHISHCETSSCLIGCWKWSLPDPCATGHNAPSWQIYSVTYLQEWLQTPSNYFFLAVNGRSPVHADLHEVSHIKNMGTLLTRAVPR
jgi:hypothetical protein